MLSPRRAAMLAVFVCVKASAMPSCVSSHAGDSKKETCAPWCKGGGKATEHCTWCKCKSCAACQPPSPPPPPPPPRACTSQLKGDPKKVKCGDWCEAKFAATHCTSCKCQACSFCEAGAAGGAPQLPRPQARPRAQPKLPRKIKSKRSPPAPSSSPPPPGLQRILPPSKSPLQRLHTFRADAQSPPSLSSHSKASPPPPPTLFAAPREKPGKWTSSCAAWCSPVEKPQHCLLGGCVACDTCATMDFDKAGSKLAASENPAQGPPAQTTQTGLSISFDGIASARPEDLLIAVGAVALVWSAIVAGVLVCGRCCARASFEKFEQRWLPPIVVVGLDALDSVLACCRSS